MLVLGCNQASMGAVFSWYPAATDLPHLSLGRCLPGPTIRYITDLSTILREAALAHGTYQILSDIIRAC